MNKGSNIKYSVLLCGVLIVLVISCYFYKASLSYKQTIMNNKSNVENNVKPNISPDKIAKLTPDEIINLLSSKSI